MQDRPNSRVRPDPPHRRKSAGAGESNSSLRRNRALRGGQRYRLTKAAAAVDRGDGKPSYLHLASGSLVELASGPDQQGRLIDVWQQGRTLVMFVEDLLAAQTHPLGGQRCTRILIVRRQQGTILRIPVPVKGACRSILKQKRKAITTTMPVSDGHCLRCSVG